MNIRFFNETGEDERNIYLTATNELSDVDIVAVNWMHPSGTFRVKGNVAITHFIADFNGVRYIYRVTSYTAINGEVLEYNYTVDDMKTEFYRHQFAHLDKAIVTRSTNIADWSKYTPDNLRPLSGEYNVNNSVGSAISNIFFLVVFSFPNMRVAGTPYGTQFYLFDEIGYIKLQEELITNENSKAIYSQIKKTYLIFNSGDTLDSFSSWNVTPISTTPTTGSIAYLTPDNDIEFIEIGDSHVKLLSHATDAKQTFTTNLSISVNNYEDLAPFTNYQIYAPFVGVIDIPSQMLPHNATTAVNITYFWNIFDGTVKAQINDIKQTRTGAVSLPLYSLITSDYTVQRTIADANYNNSIQNLNIEKSINNINLLSGGFGGAVASAGLMLSGNAAGAVATGLGAIGATAVQQTTNNMRYDIATNNNETNYNNTLLQLSSMGLTVGSSGGFDGVCVPNFYLTTIKSLFITGLNDFAGVHGYISNKTAGSVTFGGFKYWLNVDNIIVNRNENPVLADVSRRYIMGNISSGIWWDAGEGEEHNPLHPVIDPRKGSIQIANTSETYTFQRNGMSKSSSVHNSINATEKGVLYSYDFVDDYGAKVYTAQVSFTDTECNYILMFNPDAIVSSFYDLENVYNTLMYALSSSLSSSRDTRINYTAGVDQYGVYPNYIYVDVDIRTPKIYRTYQDLSTYKAILGEFIDNSMLQTPIINGKYFSRSTQYTAELLNGGWQDDVDDRYVRYVGTYRFKPGDFVLNESGVYQLGFTLPFYSPQAWRSPDSNYTTSYYTECVIPAGDNFAPTIHAKVSLRCEPVE